MTPCTIRFGQWQVTPKLVETYPGDGRYWFERSRLLAETERGGGGRFYDWPIHLATKEWVNLSDFVGAFSFAACRMRGFSPDLLRRTLAEVARYQSAKAEPEYLAAVAAWEAQHNPAGVKYPLHTVADLMAHPRLDGAGDLDPDAPGYPTPEANTAQPR